MAEATGLETRDLCRDRIPKTSNPLVTGVVDGNLSALWNPWERLLPPYRTHVLCRFDLCPATSALSLKSGSEEVPVGPRPGTPFTVVAR
jgi:hypothetical protein